MNKKRKKTPKWVERQYWSTMTMVDDELVDFIDVWAFYYFAAVSIVPLLKDFMDVAEFKVKGRSYLFNSRLPEEYIGVTDFRNMISAINLLVRYFNEGGLVQECRDINFDRGDTIVELTNALHLFANLLPYLNDRHFHMSEERYEDAPNGRHCSFAELCNLDKTIARRILPTLETFATFCYLSAPRYFRRMFDAYPIPDSVCIKEFDFSTEWGKALKAMVESWRWILERKPTVTGNGHEEVPERIYYGLHLFAEYLPEMHSD